jgi:flagellar biosynthesis chaperone FliJ
MDMTIIDITGINAQEGDEVLIFGNDLPITRLADEAGQAFDIYQMGLAKLTGDAEQTFGVYQDGLAKLNAGSKDALTNVEAVAGGYRNLTENLENISIQAATSRKAIDDTTLALVQAQDAMVNVAGQLDEKAGDTIRQIEQLQQTLGQANDSFMNRASALKEMATQSEEQASYLIARTQDIHEATQTSNDMLDKTAERLREALEQSGLQAQQVNEFNSYVAHLNERMTQQQNVVQDQAVALEKAAQHALEKAKDIRQLEQALQRDHFFSAAKFVVESLQSLALDFTRMLDGELPEKAWKAYQRGETSVFTKRLVSLRDTLSHDKLRQKFAEDTEFRTYVQRYWRQFEEMHEQAKHHDHGDLLSSIFASSDVGRLYQFLQDVLKS